MKNQTSPIDDLKHIRQMMEESSKFLSLSGISGIAVGTFALVGAAIAYFFILSSGTVLYDEFLNTINKNHFSSLKLALILDATFVLTGALVSAWFINYRKSIKNGQRFWTPSAQKMVYSLLSVLLAGGLFCIIISLQGYFKLVVPSMLLFYGIALVNSSKYSKHDIKLLGYIQITLGLMAAIFLNHGLLIWTIGFGLVHIVYGIMMYYKYERHTI